MRTTRSRHCGRSRSNLSTNCLKKMFIMLLLLLLWVRAKCTSPVELKAARTLMRGCSRPTGTELVVPGDRHFCRRCSGLDSQLQERVKVKNIK